MGVRYLTKFIMENEKLHSVEVDTELQPVPAVIDGFSLFYSLSETLMARGIEHVFSYTSIRNEIFRFMDYLTAKGIAIQCICRDTLLDNDKREEYTERGESNYDSIVKSWETDFKRLPNGFLTFYTSIMMIHALEEYSHGSIECLMMGIDADRETAVVAVERNAYVITNDSDYFIFPVRGVIHLSSLLAGYQTETLSLVPKRVRIITLDAILERYHLTYEQYLFVMISRGNDFISPTDITFSLTHQRKKPSFAALFALVRKCPQQSRAEFAALFALCNRGRPQYDADTYLRIAEKYSVSDYPENPLCFFSDSTAKLPPVPQWCLNMIEALKNEITSNQLTFLFNNFYCGPVSFIYVFGDLIVSCFSDSLNMFGAVIEGKDTRLYIIPGDTHRSQDESLHIGLPTFQELMNRLRRTAAIRDSPQEDRVALLKTLLMMPQLELKGVPEKHWTLICCLGWMWNVMKMVASEKMVRLWMKCFITALFHHAEVHKMREEKHVDIPPSTRKAIVLLFSVLSTSIDLSVTFLTYLDLPFNVFFLEDCCIFCTEYLVEQGVDSIHREPMSALEAHCDRLFCLRVC